MSKRAEPAYAMFVTSTDIGLWLSMAEQWAKTWSDGEYQVTHFINEHFSLSH